MAGKASRENGKKGGRPKGFAALEAERQRDYVAKVLVTEFAPIVEKAVEQAKAGQKDAREWLADRAFGKSTTAVEVSSPDGTLKTIIIRKINATNSNNKPSLEAIGGVGSVGVS